MVDIRRSHEQLGPRLFPPPPPGFDPVRASDEDLQRYGFPRRPHAVEDAAGLRHWRALVSEVTTVISPVFGPLPADQVTSVNETGPDIDPTPLPSFGTEGNWAGCVAFHEPNNTVTAVSGSWIVPNMGTVAGQQPPFICASWIGIDGFTYRDNPTPISLVQAGTTRLISTLPWADLTYAWFEWVPQGPRMIENFPVSPGDNVHCDIVLLSPVEASFHLFNRTSTAMTSFTWNAPANVAANGATAEWIVELPEAAPGGRRNSLGRYVSVLFDNCTAKLRSGRAITPKSGDLITMVNGSDAITSQPVVFTDNTFKVDFFDGIAAE